jgi:hypothetical protein
LDAPGPPHIPARVSVSVSGHVSAARDSIQYAINELRLFIDVADDALDVMRRDRSDPLFL